jgi:DNA-binding GntR family transcriptional regulator
VELAGNAARAGHSEELLPLRHALEAVLESWDDRAAYIAADEAFHLAIARLGGNPVLYEFLKRIWDMLRPMKMGVLLSLESRQRTDREHLELYRSLLNGEPERAQQLVREHIAHGRALLLEQLRTLPTPEKGKTKRTRRQANGRSS